MKTQPNLIYIFADQWRRNAIGFMNEDPVITPHIDKFASESMVFENAISTCPLCSPHRASLITGKYPISTGVWTNCKTGLKNSVFLKPDPGSFGNCLKNSGYSTAYLGKWHLDDPELNNSDNPESEAVEWDAFTPPGEGRQGFDFWYSYGAMNRHNNPHYWMDTSKKIEPGEWSVSHETDIALNFMKTKQTDNKPFAMFISYNPPHTPFDEVPQKYKELYKDLPKEFRKNAHHGKVKDHTGQWESLTEAELFTNTKDYYAAVSGIDDNVGRILDYLEKSNQRDNTIVVLSADHGEMLGSHNLLHKHVWYEESIGIPFIIRWPEKIEAKQTDILLNSPDHLPSILSIMGIEYGADVEGSNLGPYMIGEQCLNIPESALITAYPGRATAIKEFEKQNLNSLEYGWRGLRTKQYCYVIHRGYVPGEDTKRYLYDLIVDPYQLSPIELKNCFDHPVSRQLEEKLYKKLKEINDPFGGEQ
ncbi:MAG: sulfatase [Spirochaetaceae bacterium]